MMATIDTIQAQQLSSLTLWRRFLAWIGRIDMAAERWRSRQALLELSDKHLHDIGITRTEADREGRRGFWD